MSIFLQAEKFVNEKFRDCQNDINHSALTVAWIKKLKPDANEALLTAGLLHDIERAFYGDWKNKSIDPILVKKHQDLSALETEKYLNSIGANAEFVQQVKSLVAHHSWGGDPESDILCDADCLAILEEKAPRWLKEAVTDEEKEKITTKIKAVYGRMKTTIGKEFVKTMGNI